MINEEAKISYGNAFIKQFGNELSSRVYQLYRIQTEYMYSNKKAKPYGASLLLQLLPKKNYLSSDSHCCTKLRAVSVTSLPARKAIFHSEDFLSYSGFTNTFLL
jgi:hypothetical protein